MSEEVKFPTSIEGFGYKFNEKGELRNIETDERFLFFVKPGDRSYNQRHYEELGDVIGDFIENELVEKFKLIKQIIPVESEEDDNTPKSRIYQSDDAQECQTLLLLIQGSGVVRPGQWARQVIINDSLELGSMFPYIRKAQELKWGIIIFNPNETYGKITKDDGNVAYRQVPGSRSAREHCFYVWDKFVKNAKAKKILIVAHSYGGICTLDLLDNLVDEFKSYVKGIALTDSVHSHGMIPEHSKDWFKKNTCNWIKSSSDLDDHIPQADKCFGCPCFSAGHQKHEYTSGMAIESVFEYLRGRLKEKYGDKQKKGDQKDKIDKDTTATEPKESTIQETNLLPTDKLPKDDESPKDESPKEETNTQTQEINSKEDTTTTEDKMPSSEKNDIPMEIVDEVNPGKDAKEETNTRTQEINSKEDTTTTENKMPSSEKNVIPMEIVDEINPGKDAKETNTQTQKINSREDTTTTENKMPSSEKNFIPMEIVDEINSGKDAESAMEIDETEKCATEVIFSQPTHEISPENITSDSNTEVIDESEVNPYMDAEQTHEKNTIITESQVDLVVNKPAIPNTTEKSQPIIIANDKMDKMSEDNKEFQNDMVITNDVSADFTNVQQVNNDNESIQKNNIEITTNNSSTSN